MKFLAYFVVFIGCGFSLLLAADDIAPTADASTTAGPEARMYLRHAKDWAETLFSRTQSQAPMPSKEAQEFASGITRDLQACEKTLERLKTQLAKNADALERVGRIRQQTSKALEANARLAAECTKEPRNAAAMTKTSGETWHAIDAAEAEATALLNALNIARRLPPKPVPASGSEKAATAADPAATFGKGFRPQSAVIAQRSILDNARVLDHYAATKGPLPDDSIQEHVAEMERQLANLKNEYAKLDAAFLKEKKLEDQIKAADEQHAKIAAQIARLKSASTNRKLNPTELKETSALISRSALSTLNQSYRVMYTLGAQPVQHEERPYSD